MKYPLCSWKAFGPTGKTKAKHVITIKCGKDYQWGKCKMEYNMLPGGGASFCLRTGEDIPTSIFLIPMSNAHSIFTKFFHWESPLSLLLISQLSDLATLKGKSSGKCDLWQGRGGVMCSHKVWEVLVYTERKKNE